MAKFSPFKFLQEVRQEVAKVTWPSRRETTITTVMVFVFAAAPPPYPPPHAGEGREGVFAAAVGLFFLLADQAIRQGAAFLPVLSVK